LTGSGLMQSILDTRRSRSDEEWVRSTLAAEIPWPFFFPGGCLRLRPTPASLLLFAANPEASENPPGVNKSGSL
jgi:hypothetical protein